MGKIALSVALSAVMLLTAGAAPATLAAFPANVAVTPLNPPVNAYQNPQVAVDPRDPSQLAIAYDNRDSAKTCQLAVSTNGGAAWRIVALVGDGGQFPFAAGDDSCVGPEVRFTPTGGLVYAFNGQGSTDGKLHYTDFVMVAPSIDAVFTAPVGIDARSEAGTAAGAINVYFDNRVNIAVDPTTGTGAARIYAAFDVLSYVQPTFTLYVTVSSDGGHTFSTPVAVFTNSSFIPSPMGPVVDSSGEYYLAYINYQAPVYGEVYYSPVAREIDLITSTDHGQTFSTPASVLPFTSPCTAIRYDATSHGDQNQCPHHWPSLSMAAAPGSGHLYLVWALPDSIPLCVTLGMCDPDSPLARLYLASSTNAGATWSVPHVVGSPQAVSDNLILPQVQVAPGGRVDVAYYDLNASGFEDTYLMSSSDGGASFTGAQRLSDASSDTAIAPNPNYQCANLGGSFGNRECDRLGLASTDSASVVAWTDSRRGSMASAHNDVYVARTTPVIVAPEPGLPNTGSGTEGDGTAAVTAALICAGACCAALRRRRPACGHRALRRR